MKNILLLGILLAIFGQSSLFGQLEDGKYVYSSSDIRLEFTITDNGETIASASVSYLNSPDQTKLTGAGEWFTVNMNGADPNYDGPEAWYQFQAGNCSFSFDFPKDNLVLKQYDCKNNSNEFSYTLLKMK